MTVARRLTAQGIDTLQNYFGMAVRENKGDLIAMQRSVLGSLTVAQLTIEIMACALIAKVPSAATTPTHKTN